MQKAKKLVLNIAVTALTLIISIIASAKGERQFFPGSKYSIIPPENLAPTTEFGGFCNADEIRSSIYIGELPVPFDTLIADLDLSKDALSKHDASLISKEVIQFNNAPALYMRTSQIANGVTYLKQTLIFGATNGSVMIAGLSPAAKKEIEPDIKTALFSISYIGNQKTDPQEAVNFNFDVRNSGLKLLVSLTGTLLYGMEEKTPTKKPILIATSAPFTDTISDKKQFCISLIDMFTAKKPTEIKECKEVVLDKLNGYEIVAYTKDQDGAIGVIYQVVLFQPNNKCYIIGGATIEKPDENLQMFKNIVGTFKRK